jgi:hypothetical protein
VFSWGVSRAKQIPPVHPRRLSRIRPSCASRGSTGVHGIHGVEWFALLELSPPHLPRTQVPLFFGGVMHRQHTSHTTDTHI